MVVGTGPNGMSAAITLQQAGLSVLLLEGKSSIGGGMRSMELTNPGFIHDVCSAVHPMAAVSPFFNTLPLEKYGLEFIYPPVAAAHPFIDGDPALLKTSIADTAQSLGEDADCYEKLANGLVADWPDIFPDIMAPLSFPTHPLAYARFGTRAILPASSFVKKYFQGESARGLFAGMAAHAMLPLSSLATSAVGLVLMMAAHVKGWPIIKGGTQNLANALGDCFTKLGGKIALNYPVTSLAQLPGCHAIVFDTSPRQLFQIAGQKLSAFYRWQLQRYRYGMGVFKIDWALDDAIPFSSEACRQAGTLHLGNSFSEIAAAENKVYEGGSPAQPFVLLAQPTVFDPSRAPAGKHTAWAYCHTPSGSTEDQTEAIEKQVERFAPGFRDCIIGRHVMNSVDMEAYNPNYIGGNINGGEQDLAQLFNRPALRWSPYRTSVKGIYLCSASTPPGGAVHGMCGFHAARRILKDIFHQSVKKYYLSS